VSRGPGTASRWIREIRFIRQIALPEYASRCQPPPARRTLTPHPTPGYNPGMATSDTAISPSAEQIAQLQQEIKALARLENAVILAHNYERPDVQDVADFVGDSLGLSREAANTTADVIVFCGVHFMAETAAVLSPQKTVLLPDLAAGCSLASMINADQLRAWKAEYPGAVVVSYVNTTAEVKAESDYCCTSGNAVEVVNAIPRHKEILFCPDMFLGAHVKRLSGRENIHVWMGECHVHAGIDPEDIRLQRSLHPGAEFLVHPECGCTTSVLEAMSAGDIDPDGAQILSTEGMIRRPSQSHADEFIVATEVGILHRLRRENPSKRFFAANERASCTYMKVTTLPKVLRALQRLEHRITVPAPIADRARLAIERMIAIGGQRPPSPIPETTVDPGE
jgi:quinolinate synthase